MPVSDTRTCLPVLFSRTVGYATFHIPHHGFLLFVGQYLSCHHYLCIATSVEVRSMVVIMCEKVWSPLRVTSPERQHRIIEIDYIGIESVNHLPASVLQFSLVCLAWQTGSIAPLPLTMYCTAIFPSFRMRMVLCIQFLRVIPFPPCSCSVGLGKVAVILLRRLEPCPGMTGVYTHTELQSLLPSSFCPFGSKVSLWSNVYRVPLLIRTVPQVEIVMVVTERHEIPASYGLVLCHNGFRVPTLCLPVAAELFQTILARVEICSAMLIIRVAVIIHKTRIPVSALCLTLWSPMCP